MSKKVKIEIVKESEGQVNPIICTFPLKTPETILQKEDFSLTLLENTLKNRSHQKRIVSMQDNVIFNGTNYGENADINNPCKNYLGILDLTNKKLRIHPISNSFPIYQMSTEELEKRKLEMADTTKKSKENEDWKTKKLGFVEQFGTKKGKRKMNDKVSSLVEEKNISHSEGMTNVLQSKAETAEQRLKDKKEIEHKNEVEVRRDILPAFNMEAQSVDEIFSLKSIISDEEWDLINYDHFKSLTRKKSMILKERNLSEFTKNILQNHEEFLHDDTKLEDKLKILYYLNAMLLFAPIKTTSKTFEALSQDLQIPELLVHKNVRFFYSITPLPDGQKKYTRSTLLNDKYISHVLVLTLILLDFKVDLNLLLSPLRTDSNRLLQISREVGCRLIKKKKNKNSLLVELTNSLNK